MFIPLRLGSSLAFSVGIFQRAHIWINSPCLSTHGTLGILNLNFYFRLKWLMSILMSLSEALSSSRTGIVSDNLYYMNWVLHVCVSECVCVRPVTQSCPILCDPINCSLPGSSIRGILLARILEWVAISFSRGSSWPRDQTHISCIPCWQADSLPPALPGFYHWKSKLLSLPSPWQKKISGRTFYEYSTMAKTGSCH